MQRNKWKKGFAFMLIMAVLLSSVSIPSQTVRAAKKTGIPKTSEMNKQSFVLIKGGTFQMGSPNTENSISAKEANYYGHYPYEIEENYFTEEKLETKPGLYREKTLSVKSFSPNAWGLYNMHGNVSEWV